MHSVLHINIKNFNKKKDFVNATIKKKDPFDGKTKNERCIYFKKGPSDCCTCATYFRYVFLINFTLSCFFRNMGLLK